MPAISRHRDKCRTGHACSPTAPVLCSQFTVFANGKPILVKGNRVAPHTILVPGPPPKCVGHKASPTGSSKTVFVNGLGVGRRGDSAANGAMSGTSRNVDAVKISQ